MWPIVWARPIGCPRDALRSSDGFVQRKRVQQTLEGDLDWLQPAPMTPPLPFMEEDESLFLSLRAVSYQEAPLPGLWYRLGPRTILDSGKFYVTDRNLHLMGQRRTWSHALSEVRRVAYDRRGWLVDITGASQTFQYQGANLPDQFDPQLVAAVTDRWRACDLIPTCGPCRATCLTIVCVFYTGFVVHYRTSHHPPARACVSPHATPRLWNTGSRRCFR